MWNNMDGSGIGTPSSSTSGTFFNTSHCLIQGRNPGGNNLDGTNPANDPLFVKSIDPATAPTTGGDLRLLTDSPALNAGSNNANSEAFDLAGNPRLQNTTIDLGAFEGNFDMSFSLLHPDLNPDSDENSDGSSNLLDYLRGKDPTASFTPTPASDLPNNKWSFQYRNNDPLLTVELQKSTTLLPGSWLPLEENTDYTIETSSTNGGQTTVTLNLLPSVTDTPGIFLRQKLSNTSALPE